MNKSYENKLRNHQKLNQNDIKAFCIDVARKYNLSDYVTEIVFEKVFLGLAAYDEKEHIICVDTDLLAHYKVYKKTFNSKNILDRLLVLDADAFNLFIISTIFHEIYHAIQDKQKHDNLFSAYVILLEASYMFSSKSGSTYNFFHDRYFHEYDAIINTLRLTLDYIQDFAFDKRAVFLFNKSYASRLLKAYGMPSKDYLNDTYNSPIAFFKYFFDYHSPIYKEEEPVMDRLENSILEYQPDNEVDALFRGYEIPNSFLEKLYDIASEKIKTDNILEELFSSRKRS